MRAPLLPKLRGHFAEFLNESSLARLGMLSLPTCVGFGTGTLGLDSSFSWQCGVRDFATLYFARVRAFVLLPSGFAYLTTTSLRQAIPSACSPYPPASLLLS